MTVNWRSIMRNKTNKCIHEYYNLRCYKQRSLLHVSATCFDHPLGWCHHVHSIWSRNSAQIILLIFYILTSINFNLLFKINLLYLYTFRRSLQYILQRARPWRWTQQLVETPRRLRCLKYNKFIYFYMQL